MGITQKTNNTFNFGTRYTHLIGMNCNAVVEEENK